MCFCDPQNLGAPPFWAPVVWCECLTAACNVTLYWSATIKSALRQPLRAATTKSPWEKCTSSLAGNVHPMPREIACTESAAFPPLPSMHCLRPLMPGLAIVRSEYAE